MTILKLHDVHGPHQVQNSYSTRLWVWSLILYIVFYQGKKTKNTLKLDNDDRDKLDIFASSGAHVAYLSLDLQ